MNGWISLHRKMIESEIWEKPPLYIKVWIYLLLSAQHSDYKGLKRGQVRTSIPEIIEACKWRVGARVERPTKDQVYQVLEFLRGKAMKSERRPHEGNARATMITTTKATQAIIVTISNYADYQDRATNESNDEGNGEKATNPPRKQRQPDNINNNVNNDNKEYIVEIVSYLNEKVGTNYSSKTKKTIELIAGRLNEGRTMEDLKKVIDIKVEEWLGNDKYEKYLRPNTLFTPTNFENYLNQANRKRRNKHPPLELFVPSNEEVSTLDEIYRRRNETGPTE